MKAKYKLLEFIIIAELLTATYVGILMITNYITLITGMDGLLVIGIVLLVLGYPIGKGFAIYIPRLSHRIKMWEKRKNPDRKTNY